ncbi:unnamed protein product, partial [Prorocentrum cordatum]
VTGYLLKNMHMCFEQMRVFVLRVDSFFAPTRHSMINTRHTMHNECLEKWLRKSHFCPMCRGDLEDAQSLYPVVPESQRGNTLLVHYTYLRSLSALLSIRLLLGMFFFLVPLSLYLSLSLGVCRIRVHVKHLRSGRFWIAPFFPVRAKRHLCHLCDVGSDVHC